jgi:hypothetical protein
VWPQVIGSVATGLTGIIVAVAGLLANRQRTSGEELSRCRSELDISHRQLVVGLRHLYRLERMLANTGVNVPARPQELRDLVS